MFSSPLSSSSSSSPSSTLATGSSSSGSSYTPNITSSSQSCLVKIEHAQQVPICPPPSIFVTGPNAASSTTMSNKFPKKQTRNQKCKEIIHSGHFMVSEIDEDLDNLDNAACSSNQSTQQTHNRQQQSNITKLGLLTVPQQAQQQRFSNTLLTKTVYRLNNVNSSGHHLVQISIDQTLWKLFQCMSLAYNEGLTSPKWKTFKGLKMNIKEKIRLNNIIWRAWHIQYISGRKPAVCRFSSSIETDQHKKTEAILLEGKYWKRRIEVVKAEYNKWRLYYQHIVHKNNHKSKISQQYDWENNLPRWSNNLSFDSMFSTSNQLLHDSSTSTNNNNVYLEAEVCQTSLLTPNTTSLTVNHNNTVNNNVVPANNNNSNIATGQMIMSTPYTNYYDYANSREIARSGMGADFMQPGLEQLQPNIDFIDTFEPIQDFIMSTTTTNTTFKNDDHHSSNTTTTTTTEFNTPTDELLLNTLFGDVTNTNNNPNSNNNYLTNNHSNNNSSSNNFNLFAPVVTGTTSWNEWNPSNNNNNNTYNKMQYHQNTNTGTGTGFVIESSVTNTNSPNNNNNNSPSTCSTSSNSSSSFINNQTSTNRFHNHNQPSILRGNLERSLSLPIQSINHHSNHFNNRKSLLLTNNDDNDEDSFNNQSYLSSTNQSPTSTSNVKNVTFPFVHQQQQAFQSSKTPYPSQGNQANNAKSNKQSYLPLDYSSLKPTTDVVFSNNQQEQQVINTESNNMFNNNINKHNSPPSNSTTPPVVFGSQQINSQQQLYSTNYSPLYKSPSPGSSSLDHHHHVHHNHHHNQSHNQQRIHYKERRRVCHINAEQKRRCNIKNGFDTLRGLLPGLSNHHHHHHYHNSGSGTQTTSTTSNSSSNTKISKAAMLNKAAEYIRLAKNKKAEQQQEYDLLKQKVDSLNHAISVFQNQLPTAGTQVVPGSRINRIKEQYAQYVKQQTIHNWKFWIFSIIMESLLESYCQTVSTNNYDEMCKTLSRWIDQYCSLVILRKDVCNSLRLISTTTNILNRPEMIREEILQAITQTGNSATNSKCIHLHHQQQQHPLQHSDS